MTTFLIIFTAMVVVLFTIVSFYTSVSSGADKFELWINKYFSRKK